MLHCVKFLDALNIGVWVDMVIVTHISFVTVTIKVFIVRCYAKRGICRRHVCVCVSVCLPHSGIVSKWLNVGSRK